MTELKFTEKQLEIIHWCSEGLNAKKIGEKLDISFRTVETHKEMIIKKSTFTNIQQVLKWCIKNKLIK